MKTRVAHLISNTLNPFLVGMILILAICFESTSSIPDALKWALIATALSMLPIFLLVIFLVIKGRVDSVFANTRQQRTIIYLISLGLAAVDCVVLWLLGAPHTLVISFLTALIAGTLLMIINFWWKISLHTAAITALVTILITLFGYPFLISALLVPLVMWSRVRLGHHSLLQTVMAAILVPVIIVPLFLVFSLV
jgi:membrane-associated phospholipid phosphatase